MGIRQEFEAFRSMAEAETVSFKRVRDHLSKGPLSGVYRIVSPRIFGELTAAICYPGMRLIGGKTPEEIVKGSATTIWVTNTLNNSRK